ncbi:MAG: Calx-beta domain-containing protein [Caulobacteraceae bacterium]
MFFSTTQTEGSSNSGDYTSLLNQTLSFTSGQTSKTFSVSITDNLITESSETFGVIIQRNSSDPVSTFLDKSTFTIQDNDPAQTTTYDLTPVTTTANEDAGTITFTVTRAGNLGAETVYVSTIQGEGKGLSRNEGDYAGLLNQALTFTSGQASKTFTVSLTNDTVFEADETFGVIVQRNAADAVSTFLDKSTFTIHDNDPAQTTTYDLTPAAKTASEHDGTITFTVTRSGGLGTETLFVSTVQGEGKGLSQNRGDYTGVLNQPLTFAAGQASKSFTVSLLNDNIAEAAETFAVIVQRNAADPVSTFLDRSTFTINDDDAQGSAVSDGFEFALGPVGPNGHRSVKTGTSKDGDGYHLGDPDQLAGGKTDGDFGSPYKDKFHLGEDWNRADGADGGKEVYSVANGIVIDVANSPNGPDPWLHTIIIKTILPSGEYGGYVTVLYGHLGDVTVEEGQIVHRGQMIGHVGDYPPYDNASGDHLHLEIRTGTNPEAGNVYHGYSLDWPAIGWLDPSQFIADHFVS